MISRTFPAVIATLIGALLGYLVGISQTKSPSQQPPAVIAGASVQAFVPPSQDTPAADDQPARPAPPEPPASHSEPPAAAAPVQAPLSAMQIYGVESRVSSVGKFVQLSDEQRERLRQKFTTDALKKRGGTSESESLEAILGERDAEYYRDQLRGAFERSREQALDRELFYLSRKLKLESTQESGIRTLLQSVDQAVEEKFEAERRDPRFQNEPAFRVRLMVRENEFRAEWLAEQAKTILTPDQYQAFLQEQTESSAQDMGLWHG